MKKNQLIIISVIEYKQLLKKREKLLCRMAMRNGIERYKVNELQALSQLGTKSNCKELQEHLGPLTTKVSSYTV